MEQREKNLMLLALSGPILFFMSVAAVTILRLRGTLLIVGGFISLAGSILAFAGLVACISWIVNKKNKGRPKLLWILLGSLDFLLVTPILAGIVTAFLGSN